MMNSEALLVIGDENAVFGFALLGVAGQVVHTVAEARQVLADALANPAVSIIFLSEEWATAMREEIDRRKATLVTPLIVEIPGSQPTSAHTSLLDLVQQALGIRLAA